MSKSKSAVVARVAKTSRKIQWSKDRQISIVGDLEEIRIHGELAEQFRVAAQHLGKTPDALMIEAVADGLVRIGVYERVQIDLAPDLDRWLGRHAKKLGKTPSRIIAELLIQEQNYQRDVKGFPAEENATPIGVERLDRKARKAVAA